MWGTLFCVGGVRGGPGEVRPDPVEEKLSRRGGHRRVRAQAGPTIGPGDRGQVKRGLGAKKAPSCRGSHPVIPSLKAETGIPPDGGGGRGSKDPSSENQRGLQKGISDEGS